MSLLLRMYPGDAWGFLAANVLVQVTAVILMAWLLAHLGSRWNAAWRHGIYSIALICVLASPLLSWVMEGTGFALVKLRPPVPTAAPTAVPAAPVPISIASLSESDPIETPTEPKLAASRAPLAAESLGQDVQPKTTPAPSFPDILRAFAAGTLVIWLLGMALFLARWCYGLHLIAVLRRTAQPLSGEGIVEVLDRVRRTLGTDELPPLATSVALDRPAMVGLIRPLVILPEDLLGILRGPELADILVHECAHAVCRHQLVGLLQRLAGILFWPHPLMHLLNRELARAREEVCDNYVLRHGNAPRYARTLLELSQSFAGVSSHPTALGLFPCRWRLEDRVADLLDRRRKIVIRVNHWATMALSASFLLLALLIAGLRGPENQHQAYAADTPAVESNVSTAVDNREEMDWSLVPAKAVFVAAARPAAIFRRPEFVAHGKLLDETSSSLKVTETEQVTVAAFDLPAVPKKPRSGPLSYSDIMNRRPNGVIIYQMTKPCQFADFLRETRDVEKREYRGRTYLFDVSWPPDSTPRLRIDDRTLVIASSEDAIRLYIQTIELGKDFLGRPKFIDSDQWKMFQNDQMVVATRAQTVEEGIKLQEWFMGKPEPYLATIAPVCQETTQGIAGIRFDDEVKVHAILIGRSAEAAEKVEKEVEAARLLAATVVQALTMQSRKGQPWPVQCATEVTGRILAATRTQREGVVVGMRSAVSMASVTKALPSIAAARQSAQLGQARNNMRMLALAMYNYNNVYQHFPPAVLYGPDGKTPYSWRVAVLPFLEQEALYKQYHFDEPWDGPNNRKLLEKMPAAFRSPTEPAGSKNTNASYFVLGGPGTIFDGNKGTAFKEITDGLANTILLVEAKRDIPWTKPEDILYDPDKPLPELGGYFPGVVNTAFADATVRGLPSNISDKVLRPLITKADGQAVKIPPDVP